MFSKGQRKNDPETSLHPIRLKGVLAVAGTMVPQFSLTNKTHIPEVVPMSKVQFDNLEILVPNCTWAVKRHVAVLLLLPFKTCRKSRASSKKHKKAETSWGAKFPVAQRAREAVSRGRSHPGGVHAIRRDGAVLYLRSTRVSHDRSSGAPGVHFPKMLAKRGMLQVKRSAFRPLSLLGDPPKRKNPPKKTKTSGCLLVSLHQTKEGSPKTD